QHQPAADRRRRSQRHVHGRHRRARPAQRDSLRRRRGCAAACRLQAGRQPRELRYRKARRRAHVPVEFLRLVRHDVGPARARGIDEQGLVLGLQYHAEVLLMRTKTTWGLLAAAAMAVVMMACGGGSSTSPSPTPTPTPTPGGTTITITATGVSPAILTVPPGTQVTFVNSDNRNHTMNSDPHPEHTDCEEINQVG